MITKDKILEFVELAKQCPDKLQETCFRALLEDYLANQKSPKSDKRQGDGIAATDAKKVEEITQQQGDIKQSDIHVKVKRFMEREGVSLEDLNLVFYKEGEQFLPLFDSLGTTKTSESQIRVALLSSLQSALTDGEFQVSIEEAKAECQQRKCYDVNNWRNNFNNNSRLFDFKKFTKETKALKLSDEGKKELAQIVKELK